MQEEEVTIYHVYNCGRGGGGGGISLTAYKSQHTRSDTKHCTKPTQGVASACHPSSSTCPLERCAMLLSQRVDNLGGEALAVVFHVFHHVLVCIGDDKLVVEYDHSGPNAEIVRVIKLGVVHTAAWLGYSGTFQELTSNNS